MVKPEQALRVVRRGKGEKANKKRMATVAAVHSQPPIPRTPKDVIDSLFASEIQTERPKRPKPSHKRVWASLTASKDAFINDVKTEMTRRDPNHERTWVIVTDGERALQRRVIASFENVTLVLDLLHVLEKLWKVAHALHPEGSIEAEAFVRARTERILCGMTGQVVKGLRQTVTKRRLTGQKANTIHGVCDYLYRNRERMRYDEYLRMADRLRHRRGRLQEPHPRPLRTLRHALDHPDRRSAPQTPRRPPLRRPQRLLGAPHHARPATPIRPARPPARTVVLK